MGNKGALPNIMGIGPKVNIIGDGSSNSLIIMPQSVTLAIMPREFLSELVIKFLLTKCKPYEIYRIICDVLKE